MLQLVALKLHHDHCSMNELSKDFPIQPLEHGIFFTSRVSGRGHKIGLAVCVCLSVCVHHSA